jgi:osmoprotectant transport system substrate-binding protein
VLGSVSHGMMDSMGMYKTVRLAVAGMMSVAVVSLTGCSQLVGGAVGAGVSASELTVGSSAVAEGPLLAELYGQVLEAHSYDVFYNFGLRSRDETFAALHSGMIDLLPDFSGEVLHYLYPEARFTSSSDLAAATHKELSAVGLTMLPVSPADNGPAFVTTRAFSESNDFDSIGQIIPFQTTVTIGADPGFESGESGRESLRRVYAVNNWSFLPIVNAGEQNSVDALVAGSAQIVVMDTSSPLIALNDLVTIADPGHVLPADNLIPIMGPMTYSRAVELVVDSVSKALTTEQLQILKAQRLAVNAPSDRTIARDWLIDNGLIESAGS